MRRAGIIVAPPPGAVQEARDDRRARRGAGRELVPERRNPDFLALHDEATAARIHPIVPVVVLAQAWRGGTRHQISRVLKGCSGHLVPPFLRASDQWRGRARA